MMKSIMSSRKKFLFWFQAIIPALFGIESMITLFKWGVIDCCILICFGWDEVKELGQEC